MRRINSIRRPAPVDCSGQVCKLYHLSIISIHHAAAQLSFTGTLIKRVHPGHVARALPPVLHSVQTIRVKAQCSGCAVRAGNDGRTMGSLGTGRQYLPDRGMTQPFGATQPILHILIVGPHQPPAICHTLTRDCQLSATSRWAAVRGKQTPRPAEHGSDPRKAPCDPTPHPLSPAIGIYKCQAVVYRVLPPLSPYMGIAGRIAGVGSTAHLVSGPHCTNTAAGSDTARTGY